MVEEGKPIEKKETASQEKELLARGEIKTMKKDLAALREGESIEERKRIAQLRTEQEAQREKERQERSQKEALDRQTAQAEAQKRAAEVKRIVQEKEKQVAIEKETAAQKEGQRAEGFKEMLKETQAKEEQERKRFLARVEAQAEGKELAPAPLPPKPPSPPLPPKEPTMKPAPKPAPVEPAKPAPRPILKKIPRPSFKKATPTQKIWIRIVLTILTLAVLGAIGSFWYWYAVVRQAPVAPETTPEEITSEPVIPASLISTEGSRTVQPYLLAQTIQENLGDDVFTRLIVREGNEVWGLRDFFDYFEIEPPETFYEKVDDDFTLFLYSSQGTNRLGLVAKTEVTDLFYLIKYWENTMEQDLDELAVFLGKTGPSTVASFKEAGYSGETFRYLSLAPDKFGICWAVVDDNLIITFSGQSIIKTIDKLNE